jgi:hypothetical protein
VVVVVVVVALLVLAGRSVVGEKEGRKDWAG